MTVATDVRKQLEERLKELRPLVEEYQEIEAMLGRLGASSAPRTRSRSRRNATPAKKRAGSPRRRPRRASGGRSQQALELVRKRPGMTIPELAAEMKIQPNYLYRVMPALADAGRVRRDGNGWVAVEATAADAA
jgi:transposase